jgi:hypothetical protein
MCVDLTRSQLLVYQDAATGAAAVERRLAWLDAAIVPVVEDRALSGKLTDSGKHESASSFGSHRNG